MITRNCDMHVDDTSIPFDATRCREPKAVERYQLQKVILINAQSGVA